MGAAPDLDVFRSGLARRLAGCDEYGELFDPYADSRPTRFRLSDDLAAVAADLIHGLQHFQAGRSLEALWWWQYSYLNHWGTHGAAALRALHAIVAHALLDVADEVPSGWMCSRRRENNYPPGGHRVGVPHGPDGNTTQP